MKLIIVVLLILTNKTNTFAQCADSSDATLKETNDWIKLSISQHGEKALLSINYLVEIKDSCTLKIYQMRYDASSEKMDTSIVYEVNHREFDISATTFSSTNKKNTHFLVKLFFHKIKIKSISEESGDVLLDASLELLNSISESKKYVGLYIDQKGETNLPERIIKAFKYAKCKCGEGETDKEKKQKGKF